jgi:hypothetical protein
VLRHSTCAASATGAAAGGATHAESELPVERQRLHLNDRMPCGASFNQPSDRCLDGMKAP